MKSNSGTIRLKFKANKKKQQAKQYLYFFFLFNQDKKTEFLRCALLLLNSFLLLFIEFSWNNKKKQVLLDSDTAFRSVRIIHSFEEVSVIRKKTKWQSERIRNRKIETIKIRQINSAIKWFTNSG